MASEPMIRTIYTDPTSAGNPLRHGDTAHFESLLDQVNHADPLERMHGSGPHDWGIAEGLQLSVALAQAGVIVLPGIGLDSFGRHISLANGGKAEIGPNADNPQIAPNLVAVLATGAPLPTAGLADGDYFVSVTWRETFDAALWNGTGQAEAQMLHTPWLRAVPAAGVTDATDDGSSLFVGLITLAASKVTALTHARRREVGLHAGSLKFWRGDTATDNAAAPMAENTLSGEIRARGDGGLEVRVPGVADQIDIGCDQGNFAKIGLGADLIVARRADSVETVTIDTTRGNVSLAGALNVSGNATVTGALSSTGDLTVAGNATVAGALSATGALTVAGSAAVKGALSSTGNLSVAGTATVKGVLSSGAHSVSGALSSTGNLSVAGTATVTGMLSSGAHSVAGALSSTGNLSVAGTAAVTGALSTSGDVIVGAGGNDKGLTVRRIYGKSPNSDAPQDLVLNDAVPGSTVYVGGSNSRTKLDVDGDARIGGNLNMERPAFADSDLTVAGELATTSLSTTGDVLIGKGGDAGLTVRRVYGKGHGTDDQEDLFLNYGVAGSTVFVGGNGVQTRLDVSGIAALHADLTVDGALGVGGNVNVRSDWLDVHGAGTEQAYIGGDGSADDVQIGSRNAAIVNASLYNTSTGKFMDLNLRGANWMSDLRAKENISTLEGALHLVESLRGVRFDWKNNESGDVPPGRKAKQLGLIAQEVALVVPEAVTDTKRGFLAISYSSLVPILIEAVKELHADVEHLKKSQRH